MARQKPTIVGISIHAPREGGDGHPTLQRQPSSYFNPRPPRGGRPSLVAQRSIRFLFQSTPPARGATSTTPFISFSYSGFQSTPPARGATSARLIQPTALTISIHAPREGGDFVGTICLLALIISIHAPREGGDVSYPIDCKVCDNFNPRPPRGGRRYGSGYAILPYFISIHAPREGGDLGEILKLNK